VDISLSKTKILRHLGYKNQVIDEDLEDLIVNTIEKVEQNVNPRYIFKIFDITLMEQWVKIEKGGLKLQGRGIVNHLKSCQKCVVFAATLGVEIDFALRGLQITNMTQAVIFNACADEYIEQVCNYAELEIKSLGYSMTSRYSPGYGDFSIENQRVILTLIDAQKIGLGLNEYCLLMPQKSVTAIIGLKDK